MEVNEVKTKLQKHAARLLLKDKRLICQWATGCGKSNVALQFLSMYTNKFGKKPHTLIVVPEQNNISNWEYEFDKFGISKDNVEIICYASLHKYVDTSWDLIVVDEAPHADTDKRTDYLKSMTAEYALALGAVISEDERATLRYAFGDFSNSVITIDQAITKGILPPPEIRVLHMDLDNTLPKYMYKGQKCTAMQMYNVLANNIRNELLAYSQHHTEIRLRRIKLMGANRKRFLGEEKDAAIAAICKKLEDKNVRFLCFCASIKQAEKLGKDKAFTSKTAKSLKVLEKFNDGTINSLYVVGKCIEGQNLKNIHCGIIGQLGGTKRITVQEIGRIVRSEKPVIYIPIFDNTKDDTFLKTVTGTISNDYIKHYKLSQNNLNIRTNVK